MPELDDPRRLYRVYAEWLDPTGTVTSQEKLAESMCVFAAKHPDCATDSTRFLALITAAEARGRASRDAEVAALRAALIGEMRGEHLGEDLCAVVSVNWDGSEDFSTLSRRHPDCPQCRRLDAAGIGDEATHA